MNRIDQRILIITIRIDYAKFALNGMSRFNTEVYSLLFSSDFSG